MDPQSEYEKMLAAITADIPPATPPDSDDEGI
jgi:hypothetical protein